MSSEQYIKIFQERRLKRKKPTPYNVFLEVNSSSIYHDLKTKLGTKPKIGDVRTEFRNSWNITSPSDRLPYEEAALSLGYIPPVSRIQRTAPIKSLSERLKQLRLNKKVNI